MNRKEPPSSSSDPTKSEKGSSTSGRDGFHGSDSSRSRSGFTAVRFLLALGVLAAMLQLQSLLFGNLK